MRAKPHGVNSCRIRVDEPGEYYLSPVPYDENIRLGDDCIYLNTNTIFKRSSVKHNHIHLPLEYMNADILFFKNNGHDIYIKSSFNNHIIKKAFDGVGQARIDLPLAYRENVLTSFILKTSEFNPDEWHRVDWVQCKPTIDLKRYVSVNLPVEAIGKYIVVFEDELYDY